MKIRLTYICILAGLLLGSCSDLVHIQEPALKEDCIVFSASNTRMLTKSGLEYEDFKVGTKYLLYGVDAAAEYDWTNAILNKTQCYETEDHYIYYGPDINFGEHTYDFYGATLCSTGDKYPDDVVLTLYRVNGTIDKGWSGQPLWIPNIKFPEGLCFYDSESIV